jgi:hypothetical protein
LAFDPTGNQLVAGANAASTSSAVALVELEQHRGIQRLRGLNYHVRKVWFSPNSRLVAALSDDWSLAVWDTESGKLHHLFEAAGFLADNAGAAFDSTGKRFAFAAGVEGRLYDLESGRALDHWLLPEGYGEQLQFDSEGRLLLVRRQRIPENPRISRWTLYELPLGRDATVLHQQTNFSYQPISMAFPVPASNFVAITKDRATGLNSVRSFAVRDGRELWRAEQHRSIPWDLLRMGADGGLCGFGVGSGTSVQIVRVVDGSTEGSLSKWCLAIGPFARDYAEKGEASDGWILKSADESKVPIPFSFDGNLVSDTFTFSPDGRFIGWGAFDGTVLLADISLVRQRLSTLRP